MRIEKDWSQEEVQFLIDNFRTMSYGDIGKALGRTDASVGSKSRCLGLTKQEPWTQEELDFITQNISTMSYRKMAEHLNRSMSAIENKVHRDLKIKKSPYTCNYRYFEYIDTVEKAYWLGFIYADGYVSVIRETNNYTVGIALQSGDKDHLKKFNKSIDGNYKIFDMKHSSDRISDPNKVIETCGLRIYSKAMVNDLLAQGVNEHKTYDLQFKQLDDDLMPHFIRGYFDGNGSVSYTTHDDRVTPRCRIFCNQLPFLEPLRTYLYQEQCINSFITHPGVCYCLNIAGAKYARQFLDYIYGDATIYLDRKYHRYQLIKDHEAA